MGNFNRFIVIGLALFMLLAFPSVKPAFAKAKTLKSIYFSPRFGSVLDAAIHDGYLYLVGFGGLAVMDVSVPQNPRLVRTIKSAGSPFNDIAIEGNYAYVTAGRRWRPDGRLLVFDISNPALIRQIPNDLTLPEGPVGIVVENGIAYIGDYACGLAIVDVKDPHSPRLASIYNKPQAFDQEQYNKLTNLINSDPGQFKRLVMERYGFTPERVDMLIKAAGAEYIARHLSVIITQGYENHCWWPAVRYPYAFVPLDGGGMSAVDIADPYNPKEVGSFNKKTADGAPMYFNNIAVSGNHAFVTVDYAGFLVLDISDLRNPRESAHINPWIGHNWQNSPGHMIQVYVRDDIMYMTAGEDGLYIYDISIPLKPELILKNDKSVEKGKGVVWGLGVKEPFLVFCYSNQCGNIDECRGRKLSGGFEIFKMK